MLSISRSNSLYTNRMFMACYNACIALKLLLSQNNMFASFFKTIYYPLKVNITVWESLTVLFIPIYNPTQCQCMRCYTTIHNGTFCFQSIAQKSNYRNFKVVYLWLLLTFVFGTNVRACDKNGFRPRKSIVMTNTNVRS